MNSYLIPANTKRGQLILGFFTPLDLIILGIGVGITLIAIMVLAIGNMEIPPYILIPSFISGFLILPIPNYHNVVTVIIEAWNFFTNRRRYIWKGWCVLDGNDEK